MLTWLLLPCAVLTFIQGEILQSAFILGVALLYGCIQGAIAWHAQRNRYQRTEQEVIWCEVRRDGQMLRLAADDLVLGDLVTLAAGQVVPADMRLVFSEDLRMDESILTGESILVPKDSLAVHFASEEVRGQSNMVFAGTRVKTGKGEALVTGTGRETVMGRIAALATSTEKTESYLSGMLQRLGNRMFLLALVLGAFAIAIEVVIRGARPMELAELALVIAVAALPAVLGSAVNLVLSLGLAHLAEDNILVKNLKAIEAIGTVNTVCSDKTGTLTENHMNLDTLYLPGMGAVEYNPDWQNGQNIPSVSVEELLRVARLNNSTSLDGIRSAMMGDPMDVALYRATPATVEKGYRKKMIFPFDTAKLRAAALYETANGETVSLIKGAPEAVLQTCTQYMKPDGTVAPVDFMNKAGFMVDNNDLALENNLRIIGFAKKIMTTDEEGADPYSNAIFLGWVCLVDPPKPGVGEAVDALRQVGTRVVMITGDQKATAEVTARELGIMTEQDKAETAVWSRAQLEECNGEISDAARVFARTKPEEKLYIVESLQNAGHVVAMVGDGVNDAPALHKSDVAIAMGLKGSDAAKDSADMVLLNDRLEGILYAIAESRVLRKKVQTCVQYLVSCNLGLLFFITASVIAPFGLPLSIAAWLWLTLVMITFPTLALAVQPPDYENFPKDTFESPQALLGKRHVMMQVFWGLLMMGGALAIYLVSLLVLKQPPAEAGTLAFCTLAFAQGLHFITVQYSVYEGSLGQFTADMAKMPITWLVLGITMGLQLLVVYVPVLHPLLGTTTVSPIFMATAFLYATGAMLLSCLLMEMRR